MSEGAYRWHYVRVLPRRKVIAMLAGCALGIAGCGSHLTRVPRTAAPLEVTLGWFAAMNAGDRKLVASYFTPAARCMAASDSVSISKLYCTPASMTSSDALVVCNFHGWNLDGGGQDEQYGWSVELRHDRQFGWLIDNYGEG